MRTISLKLPEELDRKLTQAAASQGRSRSEVVRDALRRVLPEAGTTVADLVSDLAGCCRGAADLSTNPRHMRGFGE